MLFAVDVDFWVAVDLLWFWLFFWKSTRVFGVFFFYEYFKKF
jgi:hypothetical protein